MISNNILFTPKILIKELLKHQKYKKMIKISSEFILEEFAKIISDTIEYFEKEGQIKTPKHKEVLKFESTALIFWLFQKSDIFPKSWHKLILDKIHSQYYKKLRKSGYDSSMRQIVSDDFNLRYKTYNESFAKDDGLSKVGTKFVSFVSERAKIDLDIKDMLIPLSLIKKATPKFKEFYDVIKSENK